MPASDVRNILLRAMFEPEYHAQLTSNPEKALQGYSLTDQEKSALTKPSAELYRYLQPGGEPRPVLFDQAPTIMVTNVNVLVISAFPGGKMGQGAIGSAEMYWKLGTLLHAIKASSGPARFDLVKMLISELTKD